MLNRSALVRLDHQLSTLTFLISELTEAQLRQEVISGKWTIHENMAHLGRYQEIFLERLSKMLQQGKPMLGRYRTEEDPLFVNWRNKDSAVLLKDLLACREDIIQRLNTLSEEDYAKGGIHPKVWRQLSGKR